eukprot:CAMPEP_0172401628 /NCGR_PEP_ID=MMETSP1061-20121228/51155_1 /TAXON_ID=37318 /ORGANISM="Pseudo-nitzschia pungens, Strain cf. pungens" /LENGTH=62 /DNA_ID=CAMNT_0013135331 /DNA_START=34 /DNA_END=218 /DNA_ORIENTATION=-
MNTAAAADSEKTEFLEFIRQHDDDIYDDIEAGRRCDIEDALKELKRRDPPSPLLEDRDVAMA